MVMFHGTAEEIFPPMQAAEDHIGTDPPHAFDIIKVFNLSLIHI